MTDDVKKKVGDVVNDATKPKPQDSGPKTPPPPPPPTPPVLPDDPE